MQQYFFHLRDGEDLLLDPEGRMLASHDAVVSAALFEARSIIGADAREGNIALAQRIDVEDAAGSIVHSLQFEDAVNVVRGPTARKTAEGAAAE